MFMLTMGAGMDMGFPDVCITPIPSPAGPVPTPIPYPNTAMTATSVPAAYNVLVDCMPSLNLLTKGMVSAGDNTGVQGGVASHLLFHHPRRWRTGATHDQCDRTECHGCVAERSRHVSRAESGYRSDARVDKNFQLTNKRGMRWITYIKKISTLCPMPCLLILSAWFGSEEAKAFPCAMSLR